MNTCLNQKVLLHSSVIIAEHLNVAELVNNFKMALHSTSVQIGLNIMLHTPTNST